MRIARKTIKGNKEGYMKCRERRRKREKERNERREVPERHKDQYPIQKQLREEVVEPVRPRAFRIERDRQVNEGKENHLSQSSIRKYSNACY